MTDPNHNCRVNKLADTLEDRSIIVVMQRKLAREKTERFSPTRLDSLAQTLRDRCYLWALTHAEDLLQVYEAADQTFQDLKAIDDRARDLWEPLMSIASLTDVTQESTEHRSTTTLLDLARDLGQVRDGTLESSTAAHIIQGLLDIASADSTINGRPDVIIAPKVLAGRLKEKLEWQSLSPRHLAICLAPLGLYAQKTRQGTRVIRAYHLKPSELTELCERYNNGEEKGNEKNV
jgi:Protein of unknown function (DUF3631)